MKLRRLLLGMYLPILLTTVSCADAPKAALPTKTTTETTSEAPHVHAEGIKKDFVQEEATCLKEGKLQRVTYCISCDKAIDIEEVIVPTTSHAFINEIRKQATCTETGITVSTCKLCGYREETLTETTGHSYNGPFTRATQNPTCTSSGYEATYYQCSVCGEIIDGTTYVLPPLEHDYSERSYPATCTTEGYRGGVCSVCGQKGDGAVIPALGHNIELEYVWDTVDYSTCDAVYNCTRSSCSLFERIQSAYVTIIDEAEATCESDGFIQYQAVFVRNEFEPQTITVVLPATGHSDSYETGECEYCGRTSIANLVEGEMATVYGTVVAAYQQGFILKDDSDYILVYDKNSQISDKENLLGANMTYFGTPVSYGGRLQFSTQDGVDYTIVGTSSIEYPTEVETMTASVLDSIVASSTTEIKLYRITGTLAQSGLYLNVTIPGSSAKVSLSRPFQDVSSYVGGEISVYAYLITVTGTSVKYANVVISSLDDCLHEYEIVDSEEATCLDEGYCTYECQKCYSTYTEILPKKGHVFDITTDDATCTKEGYVTCDCQNCDYSYGYSIAMLPHTYEHGVCTVCGDVQQDELYKQLFGEDAVIYTASDVNPYGIDLTQYGSDVQAIFYQPASILPDTESDPYDSYTAEDKSSFYSNYSIASSYEDAQYRTYHRLMSGSLPFAKYAPETLDCLSDEDPIRATTAFYVLDYSGNYIAYFPNTIYQQYAIYYGGAYTDMNEVAAYLLAFGEVPANSKYDKGNTGKSYSIADWGEYGRVNLDLFSGPQPTKYQYEPQLANDYQWSETDYGCQTTWVFIHNNNQFQKVYNTGATINRGVCRFIYVSDSSVKNIDQRHVWYTYNHYNDFQAYLNYDNGFTELFGNISAGNAYNTYDATNPPTQCPYIELMTWADVRLSYGI